VAVDEVTIPLPQVRKRTPAARLALLSRAPPDDLAHEADLPRRVVERKARKRAVPGTSCCTAERPVERFTSLLWVNLQLLEVTSPGRRAIIRTALIDELAGPVGERAAPAASRRRRIGRRGARTTTGAGLCSMKVISRRGG
jgi:hypothetical protein